MQNSQVQNQRDLPFLQYKIERYMKDKPVLVVRDIGKELCVEKAIPEAVLSFLLLVALLAEASVIIYPFYPSSYLFQCEI